MLPASSTRGRWSLTGIVMLMALAGYFWISHAPGKGTQPPGASAGPAVPVSVVEVQRRDVPHRISAVGTLQSLHSVVVRPQIGGVVTEVHFKEGELVERGALLARIDDRSIRAELAQAEAEKSSGEADLRIAELDLSRYGALRDSSVVPRQRIEQQAALVEKLEAAIRSSEAKIAAWRVQLSFAEIRSPVSGRIGMRRVDPGNLVQAGDAAGLASIAQIDPISVVFSLPQALLPQLREAISQQHAARVIAFDRDARVALAEGRLTTLDNQIDVSTGTLRLRAEFGNSDGRLWPGQFVAVQLEMPITRDALVVPARAVQHGANGAFVYRVQDARAEMVPVVTSHLDDEIAVVTRGLAVGERVVVDGQSRLKSGATVQLVRGGGEHGATT